MASNEAQEHRSGDDHGKSLSRRSTITHGFHEGKRYIGITLTSVQMTVGLIVGLAGLWVTLTQGLVRTIDERVERILTKVMIEHTGSQAVEHNRIIEIGRSERRVMIEDERAQRQRDQEALQVELRYIREKLDEIARRR